MVHRASLGRNVIGGTGAQYSLYVNSNQMKNLGIESTGGACRHPTNGLGHIDSIDAFSLVQTCDV